MKSSKQNFENLRKDSSQIFVETMWSKFQQNRFKIVEIRDDHRHTHIHPAMTEYKSKTKKHANIWEEFEKGNF